MGKLGFRYLDEIRGSRILMYAISLSVLAGNLTVCVPKCPKEIFLTSMSINGGVSGSLKSYYELDYRNDCLALGRGRLYRKNVCGGYKRRNVFLRKV